MKIAKNLTELIGNTPLFKRNKTWSAAPGGNIYRLVLFKLICYYIFCVEGP